MKSPICDMLGIEFPLLAFSHCRDVVAAVSEPAAWACWGAGTPGAIEQELDWIDDHTDGKPYGVDLLIPDNSLDRGRKGRHLQAPGSTDFAAASGLHPSPAERIRHRSAARDGADKRPQPFEAERAPEVSKWPFAIRSS